MSELDRRLLLAGAGLAGVAALGRLAKAGPLDPPPGPVASTGKTLTEVYDKIARTDAGLAEARIPVASLPVLDEYGARVISSPGSYYLTENMPGGPGTTITINASGVDLDLNGFTVGSPAGTAIRVSANDVFIHNGYLQTSSLALGIRINGVGVVVEAIRFRTRSLAVGSSHSGDVASRCTVRHCSFPEGGSDSEKIHLDDLALIEHCLIESGVYAITAGHRATILDCSVTSNAFASGGLALRAGDYSLIERCRVDTSGPNNVGVQVGVGSRVANCVVTSQNTTSSNRCIVTGNSSTVSGCRVVAVREGITMGSDSVCRSCEVVGGRQAIFVGDRSIVEDCLVSVMGLLSPPSLGILLGSNGLSRRNTLAAIDGGTAIRANGNHNRIEENTVSSCGTGIETIGTGNLVARNHCTLNTTDYSLAAGTKAGPIVSSPADPNGSHPWANFAT